MFSASARVFSPGRPACWLLSSLPLLAARRSPRSTLLSTAGGGDVADGEPQRKAVQEQWNHKDMHLSCGEVYDIALSVEHKDQRQVQREDLKTTGNAAISRQ